MVIKIKNNTSSDKTWCGITVAQDEYYQIPDADLPVWRDNANVIKDIVDQYAIINDGVTEYTNANTGLAIFLYGSNLTPEGNMLVSQSFGYTPIASVWKARKYNVTAGIENFFDVQITTEIRLIGGWYRIINFEDIHEDDYMEFSLIDKDDVLGLFSYYGLTVGVDVLELFKFVRTDFIDPAPIAFNTFPCNYPVNPGFYLRTGYKSNGTTDIKFVVRLLWFEK